MFGTLGPLGTLGTLGPLGILDATKGAKDAKDAKNYTPPPLALLPLSLSEAPTRRPRVRFYPLGVENRSEAILDGSEGNLAP